ncbi:Blue (Type 1) copper domain protein [Burkholderia sp. 8Y]|uniref:cupredoxin domain-containing protein n=1 Tax=Burkholderia sp. 8Y TaxID=2653133 RepID=UPI0012EFD65A|nr:cupredoxin family copper-binding protein [Burkholderia sp. 8Y]VXC74681.1 Blue (Type 1) copper domain protein [Burkholderia sp. 8Y]
MNASFAGRCVRQLTVAIIVKGLFGMMPSACAKEPVQQLAAVASPTITIDNFAFSQPTLTVPVGTKITWINRDDMLHTVVDEAKSFKSDPLDSGDSFSHVFDQPGTYTYFCSLHPHMTGTIVVR